MKLLSEALPIINHKSTHEEQNANTLSTQQPGSTTTDGQTSITSTSQNSVNLVQQNNHLDLVKGSQANEDLVSSLLLKCFNTQYTFGKTWEQLIEGAPVFHDVLGEYPIAGVSAAFKEHISKNKNYPTPTCIIELIAKPLTNGLTKAQEKKRQQLIQLHGRN